MSLLPLQDVKGASVLHTRGHIAAAVTPAYTAYPSVLAARHFTGTATASYADTPSGVNTDAEEVSTAF